MKHEWLAAPETASIKSQTIGGRIVKHHSAQPQNPWEPNMVENGTTKREHRSDGGTVRESRLHLGNQLHLGTLRVRRADVCVVDCVLGGGVQLELQQV